MKILILCLVTVVISVTHCQECVVYDFETGFDESFDNDLQCANQNSWINISYEDLGVSPPFANSSSSIQSSTASCSRTINFVEAQQNGIIELTYYLGAVDGDSVNMNFMVMGMLADGSSYFVAAFGASSSITDNGWHTARFTINSYVEAAYMVLIGNFQNQNSVLLIDSFRYVQSEELLDGCEVYDNETDEPLTPAPEEDLTTATTEAEITTVTPVEETTTITTEEETATTVSIDEETTTVQEEEFTTITPDFSSTTLESTFTTEDEAMTSAPQDELTTPLNTEETTSITEEEFTTVGNTAEMTSSTAEEELTTLPEGETITPEGDLSITTLESTFTPAEEMTSAPQDELTTPSNVDETTSTPEEFTTIGFTDEFTEVYTTNITEEDLPTVTNIVEMTTNSIEGELTTFPSAEDSTITSTDPTTVLPQEETSSTVIEENYTSNLPEEEMTTSATEQGVTIPASTEQESTNLPSNQSKGLRWWYIAAIVLSIFLTLIITAIVIYELRQRRSKKVFYDQFANSSSQSDLSKPYLVPRVERAYTNPADFFSVKKDASFYT